MCVALALLRKPVSCIAVGSDIVDAINNLLTSVLELHVDCERTDCHLLPEVKSITDQFFVLDKLLNQVLKYRSDCSVSQPGTLPQQEKDDV